MGVSYHQKFEIAKLVRSRGTTSRLEISQTTGIALPTVSTLVRDLIRRGVVAEDGFGQSAGGRKPAHLTVGKDYAAAVGVEVSTRRVAGMLVDNAGHIRAQESVDMPSSYDQSFVTDALFGVTDRLMRSASPTDLRGIGVGISGIVDAEGRVSRELPLASDWDDVPVARLLEDRYGRPTRLLNMVHAATLGELRFGGWPDLRDMVFLHVGRGIAVGIVCGGRLCRGATGNSGEFGHSVAHDDGPLCYCGNRGCLEVLASPQAIVQQCREGLAQGVRSRLSDVKPDALQLADVLAAATSGDRLAANAIEAAGAYIGQAMANLINVINPSVLMLGGLLVEGAAPLTESIQRSFRMRVLPLLRDTTRIEVSRLRQDACATGAAALILDDMYATPEALLGPSERRLRREAARN